MSQALFSPTELQTATSGRWLTPPAAELGFHLVTDTRTDGRGGIFIALAGEKFDAHDFLDKALASGCAALCINETRIHLAPAGVPVLAVKDTLQAFQQLAAFHRRRFPALKVAGVTGSVGKTSVKEMLRAIFSEAAGADNVLYTLGNTNNHIGVPQNLLRLNENHRFAVIEMGTSSPGEIAPLARLAAPHAAVVNTIAPCHLEKLLSLEGVAKEKGTIFSALPPDGTAVIPAEAAAVNELLAAAAGHKILRFGGDGKGDIHAAFIQGDITGSEFSLTFPDRRSFKVSWQLAGTHQVVNAAAAASAAAALGIPPEVIVRALPKTTLPGMRMRQTLLNGITYINDAYNANPVSMKALLSLLRDTTPAEKVVLVLGGMKELGASSAAEHRALLQWVKTALPAARLITVGEEFSGLDGGTFFPRSADAAEFLQTLLQQGDIVVAKGSNSTHTELALPEEAR